MPRMPFPVLNAVVLGSFLRLFLREWILKTPLAESIPQFSDRGSEHILSVGFRINLCCAVDENPGYKAPLVVMVWEVGDTLIKYLFSPEIRKSVLETS